MIAVRLRTPADQQWIEQLLTARWGSTTIMRSGAVFDAASLPALIAENGSGLATFAVQNGVAEIVTLDAHTSGRGIGGALLSRMIELLPALGVRAIRVTTTNDNLDALRFYQRRGFRIVEIRCGAIETAREQKPAIPVVGFHGIPIRDEIELRRDL
ncbi:MAG TPA: GNAT family N-acetyltransferase [Candidatus Limnocylindria bacterium]|jgi:GNAT superfamily N-acetyltransferase|nr:GNAT family N-acetyltransferase [Candidatus Limnocylindria bacterium]